MTSKDAVRQTIEEVEALTGCPVQVSQDSTINKMAVLDMARGPVRLHRIRLHPRFAQEVEYLTCFECGFILRKFAQPPEERVDLASHPAGRQRIDKEIAAHGGNRRLPADVLKGLGDQLYNGLMFQLISIPVSLRVDARISEAYPALAVQQATMVKRQLQENMASLKPEIRNFAPDAVVRPSLAINAAYALFWARLWGDPLQGMPYRTAKLADGGQRLLDLFDSIPADPANDAKLVDAWVGELGITDLYRWIPYRLDES